MNQFMVAFELIKCFARAGQQQIKQNISFRSLRMGGMIVLLIAAALAPKRTVQPTQLIPELIDWLLFSRRVMEFLCFAFIGLWVGYGPESRPMAPPKADQHEEQSK